MSIVSKPPLSKISLIHRAAHRILQCMLVRARIIALALGLVSQAAADDPLRATHDALFASFLPMEEAPAMFGEARDEIWSAAAQAPAFRSLITPFSDLLGFGF